MHAGAGASTSPEVLPDRPRSPNFDAIRLIAACSVVFSHSFLIADGSERAEPFVRLFGPDNIVGLYGVFTFLVISGFLVTGSWRGRRNSGTYLMKRCLRIFPGLAACLVVCAVVVGPWFTTQSLVDYFSGSELLRFIGFHLALQLGYPELPGVAFYPSDLGRVVLGTYWTLRPEVILYVLLAIAGALRLVRLPIVAAATLLAVGLHHQEFRAYSDVLYLAMFFAAGVTLALVHERARPRRAASIAAGIGLLLGAALGYPHEAFAIFGSVLVIQLGTSHRIRLPELGRVGDLSYGLYLYGWPVQQVIRGVAGEAITWWQLFAAALPIALVCALISWRLVERPAIRLGARLHRRGFRRGARREPELSGTLIS